MPRLRITMARDGVSLIGASLSAAAAGLTIGFVLGRCSTAISKKTLANLIKRKAVHSSSTSRTGLFTTHPESLPITEFEHASFEVLDVEISRAFYEELLGFKRIVRPDFEVDGYWLQGPSGVKMHIAEVPNKSRRKYKEADSLQKEWHGWEGLPTGDHLAFLSEDLKLCEIRLKAAGIPYKRVGPGPQDALQLFLFDPDGNAIEIGDCAPPVDGKKCILGS